MLTTSAPKPRGAANMIKYQKHESKTFCQIGNQQMLLIAFTLKSPVVMLAVAMRLLFLVDFIHTGKRDLAVPADLLDKA